MEGDGRTVIVTGANTGLGKSTALQLAQKGFRVILACRDTVKAETARQDIIEQTNNPNVIAEQLDLASLKSVEEFAKRINTNEATIDILVNNAGVFPGKKQQTAEGFELMFGVNHLGHFYLTYLLLDKLKNSAPSRVVILSSDGYKLQGKVDFENLQLTRGYSVLKGYARSKTCNILFAVHLAKLIQDTGVTTYALHPGTIRTGVTRDVDNTCLIKCFRCLIPHQTIEEGVQNIMYCCLEPKLGTQSGLYYKNSKATRTKSYATDPVKAEKLWKVSLELCGLVE